MFVVTLVLKRCSFLYRRREFKCGKVAVCISVENWGWFIQMHHESSCIGNVDKWITGTDFAAISGFATSSWDRREQEVISIYHHQANWQLRYSCLSLWICCGTKADGSERSGTPPIRHTSSTWILRFNPESIMPPRSPLFTFSAWLLIHRAGNQSVR